MTSTATRVADQAIAAGVSAPVSGWAAGPVGDPIRSAVGVALRPEGSAAR